MPLQVQARVCSALTLGSGLQRLQSIKLREGKTSRVHVARLGRRYAHQLQPALVLRGAQISAAAVKTAPKAQKKPTKKSSAKSDDEKVCQRCGEQHPLRNFPIRKQQPDGRDAECRACALEIRQAAKPQRPLRKGEHHGTAKPQTCTACGQSLRASFFRHPKTSSGRRSVCAACESDRRQELREQQVAPIARKLCKQCGQVKDAGDFGRWSASPDGLKARCKECSSVPAAAAQRAGPAGASVAPVAKVCNGCGRVRPASDFGAAKSRTGRASLCKQCKAAAAPAPKKRTARTTQKAATTSSSATGTGGSKGKTSGGAVKAKGSGGSSKRNASSSNGKGKSVSTKRATSKSKANVKVSGNGNSSSSKGKRGGSTNSKVKVVAGNSNGKGGGGKSNGTGSSSKARSARAKAAA